MLKRHSYKFGRLTVLIYYQNETVEPHRVMLGGIFQTKQIVTKQTEFFFQRLFQGCFELKKSKR